LAHRDWVTCVLFTPDGRFLVSGSQDETVRVSDVRTGRELRRLGVHQGRIEALALAPDGTSLACCGQERVVHVLDLATGRPLLPPLEMRGPGYQVAFTPDGKALCAASCDLHLWDASTGRPLVQFPLLNVWTHALALAPDAPRAFTGSDDGIIRVWDLSTGRLLRRWQAHTGSVRFVGLLPHGAGLVSAGKDGSLRLWREETGEQVRPLWQAPDKKPFCVAISPDGKTLAVSTAIPPAARLIDAATGKKVAEFGIAPWVDVAAFAADGRTLALGDGNLLWLHDTATGKRWTQPGAHENWVHSAAFSPDDRVVVTAARETDLCVWRAATGRETGRLPSRDGGEITHVDFDGETLVSVTRDGVIQQWDVSKRAETQRCRWPREGRPQHLADAEGGLAVFQGEDSTAEVVALRTGRLVGRLPLAADSRLGLSPDGFFFATASPANGIRLWDLRDGREVARPWPASGRFLQVALLPGARGIVTSTAEPGLRLWCAGGSEPLPPPPGSHGDSCLVVSPDGRTLAAADASTGTVRVWELWTRTLRFEFAGHESPVNDLVFSHDVRSLVSCSKDRTALVWDLTGGALAPAAPVAGERLQAWWEDLAQRDAARAVPALWGLARSPEQAVPFLSERLRPVPAPDLALVARLIADLDSEEFTARRRAHQDLEKLGELAESALRQAIDKPPSAEVARAAGMLLSKLKEGRRTPSGNRVRMLRALESLEHANTAEARSLLQALAGGAPQAVLTEEARASLERVLRRTRPAP
jgi:WD40 repeat protein